MSKKTKKENKKIIEEMQFDSVQYAQDVLADSERKLEKNKLGILLGIAAMVAIYFFYDAYQKGSGVMVIWFIIYLPLMIASYCYGGFSSLKLAIKIAWKIAIVGWFIIPIFPVDLFVGFGALAYAVGAFFVIPWFYMLLVRRQISANKRAAEEYLSYCRPATEAYNQENTQYAAGDASQAGSTAQSFETDNDVNWGRVYNNVVSAAKARN